MKLEKESSDFVAKDMLQLLMPMKPLVSQFVEVDAEKDTVKLHINVNVIQGIWETIAHNVAHTTNGAIIAAMTANATIIPFVTTDLEFAIAHQDGLEICKYLLSSI